MTVATIRLDPEEVTNRLERLGRIVSGRGLDARERQWSTAIASTVGNAMLAEIKEAFIVKSAGGTDETGVRWTPLLPKTIAQRLSKGKITGSKAKKTEARQRYKDYQQQIAEARKEAKARGVDKKQLERAAAVAVGYVPHEIVSRTPGVRPFALVLMLRDTGVLLNTLTPGVAAMPYDGPNADQQTFQPDPGSVVIGTKVPYGVAHNEGAPERGLPKRQFIPDPDQIPQTWWDRTGEAAIVTIRDIVLQMLRASS